MIRLAILGLINAGAVIKIKALYQHFVAGGFGFTTGVQLFHNSAVATQYIVDVADIIITAAVQLIVIIIAAHIVAEFFIRTAMYHFAAIQTVFFAIHAAKLTNYLSVCKRLQTGTVDYKQLATD